MYRHRLPALGRLPNMVCLATLRHSRAFATHSKPAGAHACKDLVRAAHPQLCEGDLSGSQVHDPIAGQAFLEVGVRQHMEEAGI